MKEDVEAAVRCWFDAFIIEMGWRKTDEGVDGRKKSVGGGSRRIFSLSCLPCRRLSNDDFDDLSASRKDPPDDEGSRDGSCWAGTAEDERAGDNVRLQSRTMVSTSSVWRRLRRAGILDNFLCESNGSRSLSLKDPDVEDDSGALVGLGS